MIRVTDVEPFVTSAYLGPLTGGLLSFGSRLFSPVPRPLPERPKGVPNRTLASLSPIFLPALKSPATGVPISGHPNLAPSVSAFRLLSGFVWASRAISARAQAHGDIPSLIGSHGTSRDRHKPCRKGL